MYSLVKYIHNPRRCYNALEQFQAYDNHQPLIDYFASEQKFYANYLKNKGFAGKINDSKDRDVINKKSKSADDSHKKPNKKKVFRYNYI